MKLDSFKCPSCGHMMNSAIGPNWTPIQAPATQGQTVVVLASLNAECGQTLGAYLTTG